MSEKPKRKRSKHKVPFKCSNCGKVEQIAPCRAKTRKFCNNECKIAFQTGIPKSEETKRRISEAKGGVKKDSRICEACGTLFEVESWRKNRFCGRVCSMRITGQNPTNSWRKGLTKDDPKIAAAIEKQSATMKKRYETEDIWNKGLTKDTDERVAAGVKRLTKLRNTDGAWKDSWKQAMSKGQVQAHAAGKYPHTFTKPEQLTWKYLESIGHIVKPDSERSDNDPENTWYHQYNFKDAFVPDFACPDLNCIIEVNGCAIHGHDLSKCKGRTAKYGWSKFAHDNIKRDRQKYSMYHRHGWKWALVWECEAENDDFHRIKEYLG
ncbi:MAG: hypothetical protein ACXAC5_03290 [Promethearchaeota archaeon]